MKNRNSLYWVGAAVLALFFVSAGAEAQTRTLSMSGEWWQNRGSLVDIPINGGPVFCIGGSVQTGCANSLKPSNGGIPASNVAVPVSGTSPAAFSINNSGAFAQAGGPANRETVPVAGIPTVIQLASQFSLMGPGLVTTTGGNGGGTMASFKANGWVSDPQQTARLGANFTWCPPAGVCATGTGVTAGPYKLKFAYEAGPNAFGGTMAMMLRDTAVVSINLGGRVLHQLVGGTTNPTFGPQMGGNKYFAYRNLALAPGPVHSTFMTNPPCTTGIGQVPNPPGCGLITTQGALTQTLPSSMNLDWGMPWTTGAIVVQAQASGADPATTFSVSGSDSRTALGKGQITMVAGQLTRRVPSNNTFSALDIVVMDFGAPETPLLSWPALVTMVALMLLAGGFMARRHFATA